MTTKKPRRRRTSKFKALCLGLLAMFAMLIALLLLADLSYLSSKGLSLRDIFGLLAQKRVVFALRMSVATSLTTLLLILLTAIPIGYALSRYRFAGRVLANTIIDVPIILPPVVTGISLLALFSFGLGRPFKQGLSALNISLVSGLGIVMCQYLVAVSYCIRSAKTAFEGVPRGLEQVARVMGCSDWNVFWRVSVPLARNGLVAGGVMAWARAIGVFGPLMVFVGTGPRVLVMPTTLWLELSIGNIETAIAIALIMLALAGAALSLVHWLAPEGTAI
jgi:molybdate transport system permease protein